MHAVVLAGGFARRLWPLTKDLPKPLLSVGGRPIIGYILDKLGEIEEIDRIFISVNKKFEPHFQEWLQGSDFIKPIEIVAEPSTREDEKLGAVGALGFLLQEKGVSDDLIVVAGDNLFDFDMKQFLRTNGENSPVVALFDMEEKEAIRNRYGVVVLDERNVIKDFQEKPADPASTLVSTGCYFFPKKAVQMIYEYLKGQNNADAPGFFISWLAKQMAVQGFVFDGDSRWFDIGSRESLEEAKRIFRQKG
ncbi:MAG: nucleotidyltransferase family protein [Candidatus Aenigmarchaeota archaeon]|nr:nucleotidyltransferase family protein [Candidatus Aenigmarchaeota archaeon]